MQETIEDLGPQFVELLNSLSALRSLVALGSLAENESSLIRSALKVLIQNQDMERCSVFLLEGSELVNASGMDWEDVINDNPGKQYTPQRFKIGEGVIGAAALSRTVQHCPNCHEDPKFQVKQGQASNNIPGSLMCAPIEAAGELLGVLNISHPQPCYFNEWHQRLLIVYCGILGQLISNNRLLRRMERKIRLRTSELESALGEARQLKAKYENLSLRDEMTGLYNRRYFFPTSEKILARASRNRETVCLALLDLDHFKTINDQYGHSCGDLVLREIARLLQISVRQSDILARFGGEEFILLMPESDWKSGRQLAERIRQSVQSLPVIFQGKTIKVTTSIGISSWQPGNNDAPQLEVMIREADAALYRAKRNGRNQVAVNGLE